MILVRSRRLLSNGNNSLTIMPGCFVTLIFKTVIDKSQLLDFEYFASLESEHFRTDSYCYEENAIKYE